MDANALIFWSVMSICSVSNLQLSSSQCREGSTVPHDWAESGDRRQTRGVGLSHTSGESEETSKSGPVHYTGRAEHHVLNPEKANTQKSRKTANKLEPSYKPVWNCTIIFIFKTQHYIHNIYAEGTDRTHLKN